MPFASSLHMLPFLCPFCPQSMTAQLDSNIMMKAFRSINMLRDSESLQFGKTMFCTTDNLLIFARSATGFESFVVVVNLGPHTAHTFKGDSCVGERENAELVFHSHNRDHKGTSLELSKAIAIGENEVLVLKFPA